MAGIARVGDIVTGTCPCHTVPQSVVGTITSGASTVTAEGLGVARIGDIVVFSCGHVGSIISSSGTVSVEGLTVARVGDSVAGCPVGVIVSGAATVTNDQ